VILKVQDYLIASGLPAEEAVKKLKDELGIEYSFYGDLVCLGYSQIDSPKTHPIVMECRGLILEKNNWNIVSFPFKRFLNYGEAPETIAGFNFMKAVGLQKIDGSLISYFNYKDQWLMSTRSVVENSSNVGLFSITFRDLFYKTAERYPELLKKADKAYTYYFELTSPENRVVTIYKERSLHLLMMREVSTWRELLLPELQQQSTVLGVPLPDVVDFSDQDNLVELAKSLATLEEGFVAVDYSVPDEDGISYKRVKVKNPSYVAIHHLKDRAGRSLRSLVSLVMDKQTDEFTNYFPEFIPFIEKVRVKYEAYIEQLNKETEGVTEHLKKDRNKENKKEYALFVQKFSNPSYMFQLYEGKVTSVLDFFKSMEKGRSRAYLEKYLVEKLKLKDMEIYVE
jgi:T4 RnlA family RNA ligase